MDIAAFRTPGLGDTTYLLTHEGVGILVDPQRDVDRFIDFADGAGIRIGHVLETHLHNDYVSGGREAARRSRAQLVLPAAAGAAFEHVPAFHLEDLEAEAQLTIRPIHTPGHTPEHVSYLVLLDRRPVALFSGGSLLAGSAGRTDLLGPARAGQLGVLQFGSLQRLAALPDEVPLYPTHGAGSFCSASLASRGTSTIGHEKAFNPALAHRDAAEFVRAQLAGLQPYPTYYAAMGPINVLGPQPMPAQTVPSLSERDVRTLANRVWVVDARPRERFAAGHIPGSIGIELDEQFGVWAGWILPFGSPIVLVLDPGQDLAEAMVQLARIGFDDVRGVVQDLDPLNRTPESLAAFKTVDVSEAADALRRGLVRQILDVRSPGEWDAGHLGVGFHTYVPDLVDRVPDGLSPDEPVWVACASGYRATIAAGLLERAGFRPIVVSRGGIPDLMRLASGGQAA
ncbi:MAG TPA: MBL fold metallo-hydrolase [Chloroflexota bacterium]|nr:MBL fold metallo-hydrolase [Chloroflexota bacterium]